MSWIKAKVKGQITITALISVIVLITAIATPILYVTDIKADASAADNAMAMKIAVDENKILTLEQNYKILNDKIDWLIRQQGGIPSQIISSQSSNK